MSQFSQEGQKIKEEGQHCSQHSEFKWRGHQEAASSTEKKSKGTREDNTSSPEGQQDKRPLMEGQTEDNWGQWLKATLEDRGVGDLFESISGMVNKVLEKQTALFKVVAADT